MDFGPKNMKKFFWHFPTKFLIIFQMKIEVYP